MVGDRLGLLSVLGSIADLVARGWSDLARLGKLLAQHPLSAAAVIDLALTIGLVGLAMQLARATFTAVRNKLRPRGEIGKYELIVDARRLSPSEISIELTKQRIDVLGLSIGDNYPKIVTISLYDSENSSNRPSFRIDVRLYAISSRRGFSDNGRNEHHGVMGVSRSLAEKLHIAPGSHHNPIGIDIQRRNLFPFGLLDWTINDPNPSNSLSWRMLLISTAVGLFISLTVSEYYYERGMADAGSRAASVVFGQRR